MKLIVLAPLATSFVPGAHLRREGDLVECGIQRLNACLGHPPFEGARWFEDLDPDPAAFDENFVIESWDAEKLTANAWLSQTPLLEPRA